MPPTVRAIGRQEELIRQRALHPYERSRAAAVRWTTRSSLAYLARLFKWLPPGGRPAEVDKRRRRRLDDGARADDQGDKAEPNPIAKAKCKLLL